MHQLTNWFNWRATLSLLLNRTILHYLSYWWATVIYRIWNLRKNLCHIKSTISMNIHYTYVKLQQSHWKIVVLHICAIEIYSQKCHTTTTTTVRFPHFPFEFFIAILPNPNQYTRTSKVRESQQPRNDEQRVTLCVFDTHVQYLRHRRNSASDFFLRVLCKYARWYVPKRQPKKH